MEAVETKKAQRRHLRGDAGAGLHNHTAEAAQPREGYHPRRAGGLRSERLRLALAFVATVPTEDLRAAVEAQERPLVAMLGLLADARERLQAGGAA